MKKLFVVISIALISACQSTPQTNKIDAEIWAQPNLKLALAFVELPEPDYYKVGSQGLLDLAINSTLGKGIKEKIKSQDASAFLDLENEMIEVLQSKSSSVTLYPERIKLDLKIHEDENSKINSNKPFDHDSKGKNEVDVSEVLAATGADKVLVLQLAQFGAIRQYYGFTPLGAPKGYALVQAFLVNQDNTVDWQMAKLKGISIAETVIGEWNQKPEYANLVESSHKAIESAKQYLIKTISQN